MDLWGVWGSERVKDISGKRDICLCAGREVGAGLSGELARWGKGQKRRSAGVKTWKAVKRTL